MKKGFTLIELITVIMLLAIISGITVPVVNNTIRNAKESSYNAQIALIIEGAKKWGVKNSEKLPVDDETIYVKLSDLISNGFVTKANNGKMMNPITNEELVGCVEIKYMDNYNQYSYEYVEVCK